MCNENAFLWVLILITVITMVLFIQVLLRVSGSSNKLVNGGYKFGNNSCNVCTTNGLKNVLIVDVANMHVGWEMEKFNNSKKIY